ncbi:calcium-translocating P-type ATPase, PMCA-type protein (macronuclear) [Tetrahymena thermophila SB210]|uniref:P-type sodium-transporting ATPase4 n=1 Tax=Tetrahymena thermophila (strain SB210) TaxID=312017 RepID=I7M7L6_TETTS|nr:calcium-translocating P-type ATPase, PMCA-type protein [Tetrahymena thermophila SB210]EAR94179.2 calcium-translocating P-type ATPase, PMCA-type protein [Tetrahymena thermophila SB210]|eukprot:XP_001014424.2 calcium-translocating P-type ATPase, PMCA-type protein [Tetrahymena thermophila SB210]
MTTKEQVELQILNDETFNATEKFKIPPQKLINIVRLSEKRDFCEEVDEIEKMYKQSSYFSPQFYQEILNTPSTIPYPMEQDLINRLFIEGLGSNLKTGISTSPNEIKDRERIYGHNRREQVIPATFCQLLWDALQDLTLRILVVAAIISISVEVGTAPADKRSIAWVEGFAILVAVIVCSTVAAANDYKKEKQFQQLNNVSSESLTVQIFRDGSEITIHRDKVLTGDIIKIKGGMELPADGICLYSVDIKCDESVMTGEPDPVHKQSVIKCIQRREEYNRMNLTKDIKNRHEIPTPILMSGTNVLEGEGLMIAIVVGPHSTSGKIEEILKSQDESKSPLQQKLETIADDIGKFGLYSALLIVLILLIRFTVERIQEDSFSSDNVIEMINFLIIGVTVVVVAIPEGLPLSVTLSLAFSTSKMLKDKNLVRKMQACETMGGANNICSDKTGTLTQNIMYVTTLWNFGNNFIQLNTDMKLQSNLQEYIPAAAQEIFIQATAVNSTASLDPPQGDATEQAMIKFLKKCNINYLQERSKYQEIAYIPFSSQRKRMSKIIMFNNSHRMLIKGASEIITSCCNQLYRWDTNQIVPIDTTLRDSIQKAIIQMAEKGLRTIGIAYKQVYPNDDINSKDNMNVREIEKSNLILIGVLGIEDVLRPEVPLAVAKCKQAKIHVRMVTGDNKITARAIANKCGIIQEELGLDLVLEGKEFIKLTGGVVCSKCRIAVCPCPRDKRTADIAKKDLRIDTVANQEEFKKIYPRLAVMARSAPEDKYTLVVGLMENGNVVAVTGDGSNDAPALKKADVGFAMGKAGTQVAKNAADIILTDDNFSSIVQAVLWGRNIYDSIRKFLQFQLTVNIVAVFVTLIGGAVIKQELLQPIQMLWVNLIMDTFASLALATEPPQQKLLLRPPHSRNDYIISRKMLKHIIFQSIWQLAIICTIAFAGEYFIPEYSDDFDTSTRPEDIVFVQNYKYSNSEKTLAHSGRLRTYSGDADDYSKKLALENCTPSRHFTVLFNTFVLLQFFNFLNARKIDDEFNIFSNILSNPLFFVILIIIIVFQFIFVTWGFRALYVYKYGLTWQQWLICIGFGVSCNFWAIIIKLIPDRLFPQLGNKETVIDINRKGSVLNYKRGKSFELKASNFGGQRMSQQFTKFGPQNQSGSKNYQNQFIEQAGPVE